MSNNLQNVKNEFTLLHFNPRGLRSKLTSVNCMLNKIMQQNRNIIVSIDEHVIVGKNKINIHNFSSFSKNGTSTKMGGVALCVPNGDVSSYVKFGEGQGKDEYLKVRNNDFNPALNIITYYGEIESRANPVEYEERWNRFTLELFSPFGVGYM